LAELLNAKPREIRSFLSGHLAPGRSQELQSELLAPKTLDLARKEIDSLRAQLASGKPIATLSTEHSHRGTD
jgi:hypothetical protein